MGGFVWMRRGDFYGFCELGEFGILIIKMSVDNNDLQNLILLEKLIKGAEEGAFQVGYRHGFKKVKRVLTGVIVLAGVLALGVMALLLVLLFR